MSHTQIENPLDGMLAHIALAIHEWKSENSPEEIRKTIKKELDKHSKEILLKLMGFDNRWNQGRWELDHCNGRAGESSAGDYIKKHQAAAIKEWLGNVALPTLPPELSAGLRKTCQTQYEEVFARALRDLVRQKATDDAHELIKKLTTPTQVDNYLKTLSLIEHPPKES